MGASALETDIPDGNPTKSLNVAVIGAGPAGLVTARQLFMYGHKVTLFEKSDAIGGIWGYGASAGTSECDPTGRDEETLVAARLWPHLRLNIPREVMGLRSLPFQPEFMRGKSVDGRQIPCHQEATAYYQAIAEEFELLSHVRLSTRVTHLKPAAPLERDSHQATDESASEKSWPRWGVTTEPVESLPGGVCRAAGPAEIQTFDAVAVCSGITSFPHTPAIPGAEGFPGLQMHSFSYRSPEQFAGKTVLVVGNAPSGDDISLDVAVVARKVYMCGRLWILEPSAADPGAPPAGRNNNLWRHKELVEIDSEGCGVFNDGRKTEPLDAIIWATGYRYRYPFLGDNAGVAVRDGRVDSLFMHTFPPAAAPTLAFIGMQYVIHSLPEAELQGAWFARVLAGAAQLPPVREMKTWVEEREAELASKNLPLSKFHVMIDPNASFAFSDKVAKLAGVPPFAPWRKEIIMLLFKVRMGKDQKEDEPGRTYRDLSYNITCANEPFNYLSACLEEHKAWRRFEADEADRLGVRRSALAGIEAHHA